MHDHWELFYACADPPRTFSLFSDNISQRRTSASNEETCAIKVLKDASGAGPEESVLGAKWFILSPREERKSREIGLRGVVEKSLGAGV